MFIPLKRNQSPAIDPWFARKMESVNRVEKQKRPDPLIKIVPAPAELIQFGAFSEQLLQRHGGAERIQALIARAGVLRRDEPGQIHFITVDGPVAGVVVRTETFARNNPLGDRTLGLINKAKASQSRRSESMLSASGVRLELSVPIGSSA